MKIPFDVFEPRKFQKLSLGWFLFGNRHFLGNDKQMKCIVAHFPENFTEDQIQERIKGIHKAEEEKGMSWYPVSKDEINNVKY